MAIGMGEQAAKSNPFTGGGWVRRKARDYTNWCKKAKARIERRKAKHDPECAPGYGRYSGWSD